MVLDRNQKTEVLLTGDFRGLRLYQLRGRTKTRHPVNSEQTTRDVQHTVRTTTGSRELRLS